jgi:hypothetical protein
VFDTRKHFLNYFFSSNDEDSSLLDAVSEVSLTVHPVPEASVAREKEYNGLETEEELGIFQVLDRLEEVTRELTSR